MDRDEPIARLREALNWYAEQVAGCRKLSAAGDPFRHALDRDGGKRAREAIAALESRPAPTEEQSVLCGDGFVFWNPDSGEEYSRNHPVESGECEDAERIRPSTLQEDALHAAYQAAWLKATETQPQHPLARMVELDEELGLDDITPEQAAEIINEMRSETQPVAGGEQEAIEAPENGETDPEWRAVRRAIDQFAGRVPEVSKHRAVNNAHIAETVAHLDEIGERAAADTILWQCWWRAIDRERERFLVADAREGPTTPERAKAMEDAARVADAEWQRGGTTTGHDAICHRDGERDAAYRIAAAIRALSASPPEVVGEET